MPARPPDKKGLWYPSWSDLKRLGFQLGISFVLALVFAERIGIDLTLYSHRNQTLEVPEAALWMVTRPYLWGFFFVSWAVLMVVLLVSREHLRAVGRWASGEYTKRKTRNKRRLAIYWRFSLPIVAAVITVALLSAGTFGELPQRLLALCLRQAARLPGALGIAAGLLALILVTRWLRPGKGARTAQEKAYEWAAGNVALYLYAVVFVAAYTRSVGPSLRVLPSAAKAEAWTGLIEELVLFLVIASFLASGLPRWCAICHSLSERERLTCFALMWSFGAAVAFACLFFGQTYATQVIDAPNAITQLQFPQPWQRQLVHFHELIRNDGVLLLLTVGMFTWSAVRVFGTPPHQP